jgi:hypothetical protein
MFFFLRPRLIRRIIEIYLNESLFNPIMAERLIKWAAELLRRRKFRMPPPSMPMKNCECVKYFQSYFKCFSFPGRKYKKGFRFDLQSHFSSSHFIRAAFFAAAPLALLNDRET